MYEDIKNAILGKKYSLSVAFVTPRKSREINKKYRGKDKPANVLSFSYSKNDGELVLCRSAIRSQTKEFGKPYQKLLIFMVIHGMLHLKGMEHSSKMEKAEAFFCARYDQKHFHRHRRRILHDPSGSRRIRKGRKIS